MTAVSTRSRALTGDASAGAWIWDFPGSGTMRSKYLSFKPQPPAFCHSKWS